MLDKRFLLRLERVLIIKPNFLFQPIYLTFIFISIVLVNTISDLLESLYVLGVIYGTFVEVVGLDYEGWVLSGCVGAGDEVGSYFL